MSEKLPLLQCVIVAESLPPDRARQQRLAAVSSLAPVPGQSPIAAPGGAPIVLHGAEDFTIGHRKFSAGGQAIALFGCRRFRLHDLDFCDLGGVAILLFDCEDFVVERIRTRRCGSAAISLNGATHYGLLRDLDLAEGRGPHNCDAGISLNHCSPAITAADVPHACHESLPIIAKTKRPSHILITDVNSSAHRAQGIYLEGAVNISIQHARLVDNNKEGICFDWGTSGCTLTKSLIARNGFRRDLTVEENGLSPWLRRTPYVGNRFDSPAAQA